MKNKITYAYVRGLILLGLLTVFSGFEAGAQDISFKANAPKVLRAGEQFQLEYTVNANVDEFEPPDFGEFRFLGGPSQGSSTSINIVNGRTTRVSTYSFSYYLQAPSKAGTYALEPAVAKVRKKEISSNALTIEVVGASQSAGSSASSGSQQSTQSAPTADGNDLFVRLEVDKHSAYVGEQITAWIKLYTQVNVVNLDPFNPPNYVGFYKQEIETPPLRSLEREKVGDDIYYTGVLTKVLLYPQRSGEITIDPFDLTVVVQKQTRRRPQSIFDQMMGPQYDHSRINLKSKPVKLNIKPLPPNQPPDFNGAVGKFQIQASVNETQVSTNDAVTLKVNISGRGNVRLMEDLKTKFPPTFDVFEPSKKVHIDKSNQGRSGTVTYEYTAIPRHAGNFKLSPFSMSYFDPAAGSYKTIQTNGFDILVAKGEGDSTSVMISNLSKSDVELLGSDIRYIETSTVLRTKAFYLFGSRWLYAIYLGSVLLFITILIIRREQMKLSANAVKYRNRKAGKTASKRLKAAHKILHSENKELFFEELGKAMWGFLSDKLNIPLSELSKERVLEEFKKQAIEEEVVNRFFNIADTCEFARFAPGGRDSEMPGLYSQAAKIISTLNQKLKS